MATPLHGLKVVEIGVAMAGPFCAMTLGDYGADVIKIERIVTGDDSRKWGPGFHGVMGDYFASANRNKRGIAVDLKTPEGIDIIRRLIDRADVVVDNYRLGSIARAGLDYDTLKKTNPRLIYCSISGFGATGPLAERPANDLFMQAYSGVMALTGEADRGPVKIGPSVCDVTAGMVGTIGVLLAVIAREQTGQGQRVDTSLLEGQVSMLAQHLTRFFVTGKVPERSGSSGLGGSPTYRAYDTADGSLVIACFNDRMFSDLSTALGRPEWITDPRFKSHNSRLSESEFLSHEIGQILIKNTIQYWLDLFEQAGVPCSPINTLDRLVKEEQLKARDCIVEIDLPGLGTMKMGGLPVKLSETPGQIGLPPPRLGQHTTDVLAEIGITSEQMSDLVRRNIVGIDTGWPIPDTAPSSHVSG